MSKDHEARAEANGDSTSGSGRSLFRASRSIVRRTGMIPSAAPTQPASQFNNAKQQHKRKKKTQHLNHHNKIEKNARKEGRKREAEETTDQQSHRGGRWCWRSTGTTRMRT